MACLIAAPCSGSGKTLLSLALAALATRRGLRLQPFKVGPDYLDPQLLSHASGLNCRNLDLLLCGEAWVQRCFSHHGHQADLCLVEGVMGLFDGRGPGSEGSSAAVARLLDLPVVLVVEASRQAGSVAALVRGFRDHGPPPVQLAGVVLNRVGSDRHRQLLSEALAAIEVPLLGVLPSQASLELPSRHLGLLPPGEVADLEQRMQAWAALAEEHLDLQRLWPLLSAPAAPPPGPSPLHWLLAQIPQAEERGAAGAAAQPLSATQAAAATAPATALAAVRPHSSGDQSRLPVAIASDAAFHFRYPETSELLEACGLQPRRWSPLADEPLPAGCAAVLLPGGYPELHAAELAACSRSLTALRQAAAAGVPIAAECGGLLLLGQALIDAEGRRQPMAGLLPFSASRGSLSLGYRQATALRDGLLLRRGEQLWGHEFHRWQLQPADGHGGLWRLEGWGCGAKTEGWTTPTVHASWLHLHWAGCPVIPWRLAAAARRAARRPTSAAS